MNSVTKDRLLGYLAAGVSQTAAASAVGVDPSYVSQLLEQDDFKIALVERSAGRLQKAIDHDESIESLETKAARVIEQKLPFVRNALEAARIFQILNSSKKRAVASPDSSQGAGGVQSVTIVLPKAAAVSLRMNTQNQVIEVEGRAMAPLPSRNLPALQEAEAARAKQLLDTATPQHTIIDGVVRVL